MCARKTSVLFIGLILALASVAPVAAQGGEEEVLPCVGESVAGTVVEVDETSGTVTVDTGDGLCTVTLDGEYDHPIVELLGLYFGDLRPENLSDALEDKNGCILYDEQSLAYTWVDCETEDAVPATVVGENEDGSFTIQAIINGEEVTITVTIDDTETVARLREALAKLSVDWNLDEYGAVVQPGDEIATYHDDGLGFGEIVKLYAMAAEARKVCAETGELCDVTVESLVSALESGVGMGELFELYSKPAILGVGHVRNGRRGQPDRVHPSQRVRPSARAAEGDQTEPKPKPASNAGPKPKSEDSAGKPEQAGAKPKPEAKTGKPEHAGPKPKPANAGPKPKSNDKGK